jgi:hypothetical protein
VVVAIRCTRVEVLMCSYKGKKGDKRKDKIFIYKGTSAQVVNYARMNR